MHLVSLENLLTFIWSIILISLVFHESVTDGPTDRQTDEPTDRPTDGQTNGRTDPVIEMQGRIYKSADAHYEDAVVVSGADRRVRV